MYQIIKIMGVTPEALVRLHKVLESDEVKTQQKIGVIEGGPHNENVVCVKLLKSKLDHSTYCVEIRADIIISCFDPETIYFYRPEDAKGAKFLPSQRVIMAIYNALGVYPEEERLFKATP